MVENQPQQEQKKQKQDPFTVTRLAIAPPISYQLNNVSVSEKFLCYVNTYDSPKVIVYPIHDKSFGEPKMVKGFEEPITSIKYLYLWDNWVLIITTISTIQMFSEDGTNSIWKFKKNLGKEKEQVKDFSQLNENFSCSCVIRTKNDNFGLCVGSSNSEIYFCEKKTESQIDASVGIIFTKKKTNICQIVSCLSENMMIAGDTTGSIHIFLTIDFKEILYAKQIEGITQNSPINGMKILERKQINENLANLLVVGDYIGKIQLYDLNEYCLVALVNSHARMITTLDCNSKKQEIISGSEDTYVNIWKVESENDVNLKVSYRLADQIVMGIGYQSNKEQNIYVSCLESSEITYLKSNT